MILAHPDATKTGNIAMAIQTSSLAAQEFAKKAASLAPGTAKTRPDSRAFETMLKRGFGVNGALSGQAKTGGQLDPGLVSGLEMLAGGDGSEQDAALAMLGYQTTAKGLTGGGGGLDQFQGNALATLSRLAMEKAASDSSATSASGAPGNSMRQAVDKSSVRMVVNKSARHPDDLGHLRGLTRGQQGGGFTRREEELLLAAAGAENLLAGNTIRGQAARQRKPQQPTRTASASRVMPSTLERRAGRLSAQYESNNEIDCIGYDRCGGTSYGQFQIASKTGTMDAFIHFLEDKAPDLAAKLKTAGPANTGGKSGRMPETWKAIAAKDPQRFEALQHEFVRVTNYTPAAKSIVLTTGVDVTQRSYALREVLWSTAVQHGPGGAERIFTQAIDKASQNVASQDFDKSVIEEVYRIRGRKFFRHTKRVQEAVRSRFEDEKTTALALLDGRSA